MNLKHYNQLRDTIEHARSKVSKLEGKQEQLLARIESEFGVGSIEEAQKLLIEKKAKLESLENQVEKMARDWESKWKDALD